MKKIILILLLVFTTIGFAQTPEKMSYQAIVRNADGNLVSNLPVGIQISILKTTSSGTPIYVESHTITTNENGLVTLEIGSGNKTTGSFSAINWGDDKYFIKTETDPLGASNYTITGTSQLLSVPYALHAKTADSVKKFKVGDFAHGGIIFWVDETGQHGLVCAKTNQSTATSWFVSFGLTQAKGNGVYAGKANTTIIITKPITDNAKIDDVYAARICNELVITENNTMFGDWYLPSKFELNLIFQNKTIINAVASANGGDALIGDAYWSSTEVSANNVWIINLLNGLESSVFKTAQNHVRAIRSF